MAELEPEQFSHRLNSDFSSLRYRWPDFGIPSSPLPLRRLSHLLRDSNNPQAGPPIVHCSAGIGRTGTFLAIDIVLKRLQELDPKDIKGRQRRLWQEFLSFGCCILAGIDNLVAHMRKKCISCDKI